MTLTDVKIFLKKYAVRICRSSYTQDIPLIFHQTQYRPISFNKSLTLCISDLFISFLHHPFQNLRSSGREKRMTGSSSSHWSAAGGEQEQLHVLAVDDSLLDRKLIERLLKSSSYRVTTVESGKRALELLGLGKERSTKKPKVNMIITDYCMPEMTGLDLLKRVKESSSLREIPVVIMSSENVPNRISSCLEEGAEEFILKPLRPSDLSRLHHHMLRINRVRGVS